MSTSTSWLVKSEPSCYSIDDLKRDRKTCWSGVRNYQARNFMRDEMKPGHLVIFYHSNAATPTETGAAGLARVCRGAYPDHTARDRGDDHYDPKASEENPIWVMVDLEFVERFHRVVSLKEMKSTRELKGMPLLQPGQRLSVMPVDVAHLEIVRRLARRT